MMRQIALIVLIIGFVLSSLCLRAEPVSNEEGWRLIERGNELYRHSEFKGALSEYERALRIFEANEDKQGIGAALTNIGVVYCNLGDYPRALRYLEEALKIHREIPDRKGEAADLTNIGLVYFDLGDYPKALGFFEEALKIHGEIGDRKGEGNALGSIGNVYDDLGDYPRALGYYEEAKKIFREIGDRKGEGDVLGNIGVVYGNLGDYPRAFGSFEEAKKIHREIGDRKGEANALNNIGVVYGNLGDYPRAFGSFEEAKKIHREIGDRKGEATDLNNIGLVYFDLGDYPKALGFFEEALKIFREIGVPTDRTEVNIGDVYLELGRLKEAFSIFERLNQPIRLGRYYLVTKDYEKVRKEFLRSLSQGEETRNAELLLADYIGLGLSFEGLKDYLEAKRYYQKAVELIERQREALTEPQRRYFFSGKVMGFERLIPYEGLARLSFYLEEEDKGFKWAEATKARLLNEAIAKRFGKKNTYKIPANLLAEETELTNRIASLYKQQEIAYQKNNTSRYKEIEEELSSLKREQKRFISDLRRDYPEYASIMYPEPMELSEIRLNKDEVLIEYEVTSSKTLAWLIKEGKIIKAIQIPVTREGLNRMVREYRAFFEKPTHPRLYDFDPKKGRDLYELLIKDLLEYVREEEKLIIVPDEILGILPFEALVVQCPEERRFSLSNYGPYPEGVTYLADKHKIAYYQSATALTITRDLAKEKRPKKRLLVVADPVFSESDPRIKGKDVISPRKDEYQRNLMNAVLMHATKDEELERLPAGSQLARELKASLGKGVETLLGLSAREEEIKRRNLDYNQLLFYTHGILDNAMPYITQPALVLTLVGISKREEDHTPGFLTMSEVMSLNTQAKVALLTACSTGLGKDVGGEGVMGMGRAFMYAGASSVLVSLWKVEPESTSLLSKWFLIYLNQGKDSYTALKEARANLRQQGYRHPFYWAAFVLHGEGGKIASSAFFREEIEEEGLKTPGAELAYVILIAIAIGYLALLIVKRVRRTEIE